MRKMCPFRNINYNNYCYYNDCMLFSEGECTISAIANNLKKKTIEPVDVKNVEFVPNTRTTAVNHVYDSPLPTTITTANSRLNYHELFNGKDIEF